MEIMDSGVKCEECDNRFQPLWNKIVLFFHKGDKIITKKEAFDNATYGKCMTREQFVLRKQTDINSLIRNRVVNISYTETDFEKYFLILPFNDVEEECAEEILKPFKEAEYEIDKISDKVDMLKGTNTYLMGWKKEYKFLLFWLKNSIFELENNIINNIKL